MSVTHLQSITSAIKELVDDLATESGILEFTPMKKLRFAPDTKRVVEEDDPTLLKLHNDILAEDQ